MFLFAKDIFLINISSQLLDASQLIIVTRTMGLSAAAMWSVGTKIFSLIYQLLTKIEGTAIVFFSEMMVCGEHERLKTRFRQIYQLSAGFAVASIAVAVAINAPFVSLWAEPTLAWKLPLSGLMGLAVFLNVVTRCHVDLILHTKTVSGLRYLYLLEAVAFVSLAFVLAPLIGFYGIVSSSVFCIFLVRYWYAAWRTASYFRIPVQTIGWIWLKGPLLASLLLLPFIVSSPWIAAYFSSSLLQLVATVLWTGIPALMVLAFLALPVDISVEIRRTLSQQAQAIICAIRAMF
jgi:O-antigen/teichoic acid export membrane protein